MASPAIPMTDTRTTDVPLDAISTVTAQALNWPETARALVISDQATYLDAAELLKGIKGLRGEVEATFGPIVSKAPRGTQGGGGTA